MESAFTEHYKKSGFPQRAPPEFHIVLGSGFSLGWEGLFKEDIEGWEEAPPLRFQDVPGLKSPSAPSHVGVYRYFTHKPSGRTACFQGGRLHGYEGLAARDIAQTVILPRLAGTEKFILTNISGSLREDMPPGEIVAVTDHINLTGQNPLTGENPKNSRGEAIGPRFPNMEGLYCPRLTAAVAQSLVAEGLAVRKGVYLAFPGPSLETPAETALFAKWGASAVGMSTVFEAVALKHAGAAVAAFSLAANFACGIRKEVLFDEGEMRRTVQVKAPSVLKAFLNFLARAP